MSENVVYSMNKLANRIIKNRNHMEPTLLNVPYVEVIMAQKPLSPYLWGSGSISRMIEFHQRHVTLRQSFYYESDGSYFKHTDEFFVPFEILPAHILEKIFQFDGEADITEEINHELFKLNTQRG